MTFSDNLRSLISRISHTNCSRRRRRWARNSMEVLESRMLLSAAFGLLKDINAGEASSVITEMVEFDGWLYFTSNDGIHGSELWKTDGTPENTAMVVDLLEGPASASPRDLTVFDGALYFVAYTAEFVTDSPDPPALALFRTDGTEAGTSLVHEFNPALNLSAGIVGASADDLYLYRAPVMSRAGVLMRSDGTSSEPAVLMDGFIDGFGLSSFTVVNDHLYFTKQNSADSLWQTDGTSMGTVAISDMQDAEILGIFQEQLFVSGREQETGPRYLWKLESPTASPERIFVEALNGPRFLSGQNEFAVVKGKILFSANGDGFSNGFWRSNGTSEGTFVIVNQSGSGLSPQEIIDVGGSAYFSGRASVPGRTLWRSDANNRDTLIVSERVTGLNPTDLFAFENMLFFTATTDTPADGSQLWISSGRATGTSPVMDFLDLDGTRNHQQFAVLGDRLLMLAENEQYGQELFVLTLGDPLSVPVMVSPASVTTDPRPVFSWSEVDGTDGYEMWIKHQTAGVDRFFVGSIAGNEYLPDHDLPIGFYSVWVRALGMNGSTNGPWTSQYNFRVRTPVTVITPDLEQTTSRPTITWESVAGAERYDVWIDRLDSGTSQFIRDVHVEGESFTPSEDMPIGRYRIWVRGIDVQNNPSYWSVQSTFHVVPAPEVTGGNLSTFGETPTIAWSPVPGAAHYEVYLTNWAGGKLIHYERGITETSWTPPALASADYKYWVLAVGEFGIRSLWSDPVLFSTRGKTVLLSPTGVVPGDPYPVFLWREVVGAVRYELYGNRVHEQQGVINLTDLTTNSYTQSSPATFPSGTYRLWVRAISSDETFGPWSDFIVFEVEA